jgi:thioredoxin-related protein
LLIADVVFKTIRFGLRLKQIKHFKMINRIKLGIVACVLAVVALSGYAFSLKPTKEKPATANEINWISFEQAVKLSKKEPRQIMIDVYTQWCGWCKKMDATTFKDPTIVNYVNKNFYAVKLDAETKDTIHFRDKIFVFKPEYKANELALFLMNGQMSYPTSIYLDENFAILSPVPGFQQVNTLDMILKFYGENSYKTTSWEEFQKTYKPGEEPKAK